MKATKKETNPKDSVGIRKVPFSVIPMNVVAEVGLGLFEGARKYGRHNYRAVGIRASVYFDATLRHLTRWWEGEDIDEESDLSHVTKAITSLIVLRDAMLQNKWHDDRPPKTKAFMEELNIKASQLIDKYPNSVKEFTELNIPDYKESQNRLIEAAFDLGIEIEKVKSK